MTAIPTQPPGTSPGVVTDATFERDVRHAPGVVLVEAWAAWCGPCHQLRPVLEEVAVELGDRLRVLTLDTDANPVSAAALRVLGLPTVKVFRDGEEIGSLTGARPKRALLEQLERILA